MLLVRPTDRTRYIQDAADSQAPTAEDEADFEDDSLAPTAEDEAGGFMRPYDGACPCAERSFCRVM